MNLHHFASDVAWDFRHGRETWRVLVVFCAAAFTVGVWVGLL